MRAVASNSGVPATLGSSAASQALAEWHKDRREALWTFLSASLICWVIWLGTSGTDGFPWPIFVSLGTGLHVGRLQVMKSSIVSAETARLERKQAARELKAAQRPADGAQAEPGPSAP